jgi:hypothetical protein
MPCQLSFGVHICRYPAWAFPYSGSLADYSVELQRTALPRPDPCRADRQGHPFASTSALSWSRRISAANPANGRRIGMTARLRRCPPSPCILRTGAASGTPSQPQGPGDPHEVAVSRASSVSSCSSASSSCSAPGANASSDAASHSWMYVGLTSSPNSTGL